MPHFSRLTDIITCSISEILNTSTDPTQTLREIIDEMNEGLTACRRNVKTSATNGDRLKREIADYESQITEWKDRAKQFLSEGDEDGARDALRRKVEVEDLIAGLRPELDAANSTCQHMLRIQKALEARQAEAIRKMEEMTGMVAEVQQPSATAAMSASAASRVRANEVEAELEALKRELGS
jgi:phage shock protein A